MTGGDNRCGVVIAPAGVDGPIVGSPWRCGSNELQARSTLLSE